MQTVVPEVRAARATVARVAIGQLTLGPINVGELVATDVRTTVRSGRAELRDVHVTVSLELQLVWSLVVPVPWPFPDFVIARTTSSLGTVSLPFSLPELEVPGLQDIDLVIPKLTAAGVVTQADPVTGVELAAVQATGVRVVDVALPTAGFQFAGLALTGVRLNDAAVPATAVRSVAVQSVQGAPARLPSLQLRNLDLPAALANDVVSGPIDVPLNAPDAFTTPNVDLGVLQVKLRVTASARTQVAQMQLTGVRVAASARTVELRDVTVPYGAVGLTLSDLGLDQLEIPLVGVT
jgi:hypothetical protein